MKLLGNNWKIFIHHKPVFDIVVELFVKAQQLIGLLHTFRDSLVQFLIFLNDLEEILIFLVFLLKVIGDSLFLQLFIYIEVKIHIIAAGIIELRRA